MGFPFLTCSEDVSKRQKIALLCKEANIVASRGQFIDPIIFMSFHYKIHLPPSLPIFQPPGKFFRPIEVIFEGENPPIWKPAMRNSGIPNGPSEVPRGGGG